MTSLEAFLNEAASRDHALGSLLRSGDEEQGLLHTPREIAQQPWLWRETAARLQGHAEGLRNFLDASRLFSGHCRPSIVLAGAGTSDYVGMSLADLYRRKFDAPSFNWPTTRITASPGAYFQNSQDYLVIHFSRSGESPESRAVLELSLRHHRHNTHHIVITCNAAGELAGLARKHPDRVYLIVLHEATNDRGLAMTSSFTNMVVAGQALAYLDKMDEFVDLIDRITSAGTYLIDEHADAIFDLASPDVDRAFFLGNLDQLGAAVESALKTQELTAGAVASIGEDTLALRHGPISAVGSSSLVCFYISAVRYTSQYELDVLHQFRPSFVEMGARTVVVGGSECGHLSDAGVSCLSYDPTDRWKIPAYHQVNLSVLFGQLFGLFASYRRGLNVDDPAPARSLYTRTVKGVRLYDFQPD